MASQALWRLDPKGPKGLDGTFAYDWSPPSMNRNNRILTAGLRPWKPEHGIEFNTLLDPLPMLLLQPVVQYYANVGGMGQSAVVFGFRTKVEF
jgi:porin